MYKDDIKFPDSMYLASFWMDKISDSKDIIISCREIEEFNIKLKSIIPSLYFLEKEEETISSKTLVEHIQSYGLPLSDMYDSNGKLIGKDYYEEIIDNTNLDGIKDYTAVKYGISIRKSSIRSFPVENAIFSSTLHSKINNFDRFQETGFFSCEPVLILHESRDKKWYFVKIYNYFGWVKTDDIALSKHKEEVFDYANCKDFLMVTGKEATLIIDEKDSAPITIKCGMGTKLCTVNNMVRFPTRNNSGQLIFKSAFISENGEVIKGNLPYTKYNIINQALKFIDTPYDWGDKFLGRDCSSFILSIYKCFGFLLPRNADEQEDSFLAIDKSILFNKEDTIKNRYSKMEGLRPGAALFMKGHVMMYLGKYKGNHYMIHSFAGYGVKKQASLEARTALLVAISPVDLLTGDGVPFIEKFTSAIHYE
jgi:hypothetical protein